MTEWIESLKENFSFSDVIAFLSMIGAIIATIAAWVNKRKASQSEARAKQYAKNADEANQSAKRYYDEMIGHLERQNKQIDKAEIKKAIIMEIKERVIPSLAHLSEKVGVSVTEIDNLINELNVDGYKIYRHDNAKDFASQTVSMGR